MRAKSPGAGRVAPCRRIFTDHSTIIGSGLKHLVRVTVDLDGDKGDKTGTVVATGEHPFWVDNSGEWTNAEDLEPGDQLRTPTGALVEVLRIHTQTRTRTVHNLTIAQVHTYYVGIAYTDVLAHNAGRSCDIPVPHAVAGRLIRAIAIRKDYSVEILFSKDWMTMAVSVIFAVTLCLWIKQKVIT